MTPHQLLALRKAFLAQAEAFPPYRPDYDKPCRECDRDLGRFDEADDRNVCLGCLRSEIASLADYCRSVTQDPDEEPICPNGNGLTYVDSDEKCRCPDCLADQCDHAMNMMEDR